MTEFVDVVIVGAGISGISAAWHLQDRCPDKSYLILERRENLGGTWDLFKYPGLRSDSDMYTLGFRFKPWTSEQAIADGPSILNYLKEAAAENGIDKHMRFGQKVVAADWSDADNRWDADASIAAAKQREISCSFLFGCTGYYNYDEGYTPRVRRRGRLRRHDRAPAALAGGPRLPGQEDRRHRQRRHRRDADPRADRFGCGHVTMLQRSPTYIARSPTRIRSPRGSTSCCPRRPPTRRPAGRPSPAAPCSTRSPGSSRTSSARHCAPWPSAGCRRAYDFDKHFSPTYKPWDQRRVPGAERRPVQGDPQGQGRRRHRHHRTVHRERASS